jgi:hypothetical protein
VIIYLFLCLLIFFVFGVLKFLECILYILSSVFSMIFFVITCKISSLRVLLWAFLGSLVSFTFVFWELETVGIHFLHLALNPVLNYFIEDSHFHPFFFFSLLYLVLCNYVLDKLVCGFSQLFFFPLPLGLIFRLWLSWFLARLLCSFYLWSGGVIWQ